jgi:hypothetical protein
LALGQPYNGLSSKAACRWTGSHVLPKHADEPAPGGALPFAFLNEQRQPEDRLQADVLALRALLAGDRPGWVRTYSRWAADRGGACQAAGRGDCWCVSGQEVVARRHLQLELLATAFWEERPVTSS